MNEGKRDDHIFEGQDMRLDVFLSELYENISRTYLQKLIKGGLVIVDGKARKKNYILQSGDHIEIVIPEPELLNIEPEPIEIEMIYEDDFLAVVNKPRGMVVHPAPGHYSGTLVNALLYKLGNMSDINGVIRPGIVHRIDKDTTGLLVVAKDNPTHIGLSQQLKEHKADRIYFALVKGNVTDDKGKIQFPIGRDSKDRKRMAVTTKNAKEAITYYQVVKRYNGFTLLELKLETGRTHQIRVHLSYIGHPIVGDKQYGNTNTQFELGGQLLHAQKLSFVHPIKLEKMMFECPLPEDFTNVLNKMEEIK